MRGLLTLVLVLGSITLSICENDWVEHAKFKNFNSYFPNLVQHIIYEIEDYGWWNLRLRDQKYNINEQIYDRLFNGTVDYTNGFLVGNGGMEMVDLTPSFAQDAVTKALTGSMRTTLKFFNMKIGYDVHAQLGELGDHRFTGVFNHPEVHFKIGVVKNFNTNVFIPECSLTSFSAGSGNYMQFLPENDIAEVLERHYKPSNADDGVSDWCASVISPAILKLVDATELGFPEMCFNCE